MPIAFRNPYGIPTRTQMSIDAPAGDGWGMTAPPPGAPQYGDRNGTPAGVGGGILGGRPIGDGSGLAGLGGNWFDQNPGMARPQVQDPQGRSPSDPLWMTEGRGAGGQAPLLQAPALPAFPQIHAQPPASPLLQMGQAAGQSPFGPQPSPFGRMAPSPAAGPQMPGSGNAWGAALQRRSPVERPSSSWTGTPPGRTAVPGWGR